MDKRYRLTWNPVAGASGYDVWIRKPPDTIFRKRNQWLIQDPDFSIGYVEEDGEYEVHVTAWKDGMQSPASGIKGFITDGLETSNVSQGGIHTASSGTNPSRAWNGNNTNYATADTGGSEWFQVDLEEQMRVLHMTFRCINNGRAPENWALQGSNNEEDWDNLLAHTSPQANLDLAFDIKIPQLYRYYRIFVTNTFFGGGVETWLTNVKLFAIVEES